MSTTFVRLQVYVAVGPFVGLICFYIYHSVYFFYKTGSFSNSGDMSFFIVLMACVLGVLPASITALIVSLIVKKRPEKFITLRNKIFIGGVIGFTTIFILKLGLSTLTGEMGGLFSYGDLSLLACVIYGACAGIVCEFLYSKYLYAI